MIEKKSVVDDLRLSYNGTFDIAEFFKAVEDWREANGSEKEIKKRLEHITRKGKNIEWSVELWKKIAEHDKYMTRVKALFNDVTEVFLVKGGFKRKLQNGNVLIILDSFLETDYHHEWIMTPWFYFLRSLFDRYIYNFWMERHVSKLRAETYNLHRTLTAFFNLYKYSQPQK